MELIAGPPGYLRRSFSQLRPVCKTCETRIFVSLACANPEMSGDMFRKALTWKQEQRKTTIRTALRIRNTTDKCCTNRSASRAGCWRRPPSCLRPGPARKRSWEAYLKQPCERMMRRATVGSVAPKVARILLLG